MHGEHIDRVARASDSKHALITRVCEHQHALRIIMSRRKLPRACSQGALMPEAASAITLRAERHTEVGTTRSRISRTGSAEAREGDEHEAKPERRKTGKARRTANMARARRGGGGRVYLENTLVFTLHIFLILS